MIAFVQGLHRNKLESHKGLGKGKKQGKLTSTAELSGVLLSVSNFLPVPSSHLHLGSHKARGVEGKAWLARPVRGGQEEEADRKRRGVLRKEPSVQGSRELSSAAVPLSSENLRSFRRVASRRVSMADFREPT